MAQDENIFDRKFVSFETATAYRHPWKTPLGVRFSGDANFRGRNKSGGAMFSLWVDPSLVSNDKTKNPADVSKTKTKAASIDQPKEKKQKKGKGDKVKVVVYNSKGDSIRQFSFKADSMIVRRTWNMTENGVRGPRRKELTEKQKKGDPPSGVAVLPGEYKLIFKFKGYSDSTMIRVEQHPKYMKTEGELQDRYDMGKAFQLELASITKTVERLKEMKSTVVDINAHTKYLPDSIADTLKAKGKAISDSVNSILDLFFLKEGFKGYDHVTQNISTRIGTVRQYMYAENALENEGLSIAWRQLQNEVTPIMERVNRLTNNEWMVYSELIRNTSFEYFKNYDSLNYGR